MELNEEQRLCLIDIYRLSPRQMQVIELLLRGCDSDAKIAKELGVTVPTAKTYLRQVFMKLRVSSKAAAIIEAIDALP